MRFIAVILSMYVMVLTALPCDDVHTSNSNPVSVELSEQSPDQSNDVDLCSPFCFCHCCQTLSFPSFFNSPYVNIAKATLDIMLKEPAISNPVASIWQPPKI